MRADMLTSGFVVQAQSTPIHSQPFPGSSASLFYAHLQMTDGESAECCVTYVCALDLKGWVPSWIADELIADIPLRLGKLREHALALSAAAEEAAEEAELEEQDFDDAETASTMSYAASEPGTGPPKRSKAQLRQRLAQLKLRDPSSRTGQLCETEGLMMSPRLSEGMGLGTPRNVTAHSRPHVPKLALDKVAVKAPRRRK